MATPRWPDVEKLCAETAARFGLKADCRQSNREGELIDFIHEAHTKKAAGIIINAGAYSHTSIALHDALVAVKIPTVEVHISNVHARRISGTTPSRPRLLSRRFPDSVSTVTGSRFSASPPRSAPRHKPDARRPKTERQETMARQPDDKPAAKSKNDDSALIRELALLLDETNLTEIEIERAGLRVRGRAQHQHRRDSAVSGSGYCRRADWGRPPGCGRRWRHVQASRCSHLADGRHRPIGRPEPGAKPFIEIGAKVSVGADAPDHRSHEDDEPDSVIARGHRDTDPGRRRPAGRIRRAAGNYRMRGEW